MLRVEISAHDTRDVVVLAQVGVAPIEVNAYVCPHAPQGVASVTAHSAAEGANIRMRLHVLLRRCRCRAYRFAARALPPCSSCSCSSAAATTASYYWMSGWSPSSCDPFLVQLLIKELKLERYFKNPLALFRQCNLKYYFRKCLPLLVVGVDGVTAVVDGVLADASVILRASAIKWFILSPDATPAASRLEQ